MQSGCVVAYDAGCGPCSRFKAILGFLDVRHNLTFVSLQDAERAGLLDGIMPLQRYASFHLVSSTGGAPPRSGADALLPLFGALLGRGATTTTTMTLSPHPLESVPGLKAGLAFAYSILSRLHDVGACST